MFGNLCESLLVEHLGVSRVSSAGNIHVLLYGYLQQYPCIHTYIRSHTKTDYTIYNFAPHGQ